LITPHDGQWLAEGLEHHLTAQAPSWQQAIRSFVRTLQRRLQLDHDHGRQPLADLSPAPESVFETWERLIEQYTDDLITQPVTTPDDTPEAYVINQVAKNDSTADVNA